MIAMVNVQLPFFPYVLYGTTEMFNNNDTEKSKYTRKSGDDDKSENEVFFGH